MRLAVTGSRDIDDYMSVSDAIDDVLKEYGDMTNVILSGGAKGVQSCAKTYCEDNPMLCTFICFEPQHEVDKRLRFDARNFYTRNVAMLRNADALLAIWDGKDTNTDHAIKVAKQLKIPVIVEIPENQEDYIV